MTGNRPRFTIIDDIGDLPPGVEWVAVDLGDLFRANPYARTRSAGPAGASYMVEIITDPNDRRGFDARPVRAA